VLDSLLPLLLPLPLLLLLVRLTLLVLFPGALPLASAGVGGYQFYRDFFHYALAAQAQMSPAGNSSARPNCARLDPEIKAD
jgi:hypothetical protein